MDDLEPFHSLHTVDVQALRDVDEETRRHCLMLLDTVEEPDWRDALTRLFSFLKLLNDNFSEYDENTVIPLAAVRNIFNRILTDPKVAGDAFQFLEHNRRALDILALEQLLKANQKKAS